MWCQKDKKTTFSLVNGLGLSFIPRFFLKILIKKKLRAIGVNHNEKFRYFFQYDKHRNQVVNPCESFNRPSQPLKFYLKSFFAWFINWFCFCVWILSFKSVIDYLSFEKYWMIQHQVTWKICSKHKAMKTMCYDGCIHFEIYN